VAGAALTIGELGARAGVATSALRYYEAEGLIASTRTSGGQRRYERDVLRRVAFIHAAQRVGVSLAEIRDALVLLPGSRTPTADDWEALSTHWHAQLTERIELLERLRDQLGSCIGCGCLSMDRCALYNPGDGAARLGAGARYLLGDAASSVMSVDL
jgi:MerR family transcriptional regulator, redox-sensitive transcriptional activator SoxR